MINISLLNDILYAMSVDRPTTVVVESRSETKITRSKDMFGTISHKISHIDGNDKPIYRVKLLVEFAPGVWIDAIRYSRLGLLAEAKEAQNTGK